MRWSDFAAIAPQLAARGETLLTARSLALLATLRRDGSPRVSPIEPAFASGRLLVGAMSWSQKATDLRRDPRFSLHSPVTDVQGSEGEFQLFGRAERVVDEGLLSAAPDAWWGTHPDRADVFALDVEEAVLVTWDLERSEMTVARWTASTGVRESRRRYP
ncbi:MAG TPA: pyridoxamine 5'-phosphate oxidase family protein [Candidatus Limnocylindria bacterium]|nr:pyridoxamine 5'-phosphate oxidase family protein [Candidatus Limnocylindria bacterium]